MKCPGCGAEVAEGNRFCTGCGKPTGDQTVQMPAVPQQLEPAATLAPVQPVPAGAAAAAPPTKRRRTSLVILVVLLAVLLLGGAAAGIIIWRVSVGNREVAEINSVGLERAGGEELDLDRVPLDTRLSVAVKFRARFGEDGRGVLKLSVNDSDGKKIAGETWQVKSSGDVQTEELEYSMDRGNGEPVEARAELEVTVGDRTITGTGSLTYTAAEGKGKKIKLEEARKRAAAKLKEATDAVKSIVALGINAGDLTRLLDRDEKQLEEAGTVGECNEVYDSAQSIINDCNARRATYEKEQKNKQDEQTRQQDITRCQQVMLDYATANSQPLANLHLEGFTMNNERTHAEAVVVGTITAQVDPDNAGTEIRGRIVANKEGGQWAVVFFGSE